MKIITLDQVYEEWTHTNFFAGRRGYAKFGFFCDYLKAKGFIIY